MLEVHTANVRGLRDPRKKGRLKLWLESRRPHIMVLQETHCGPGEESEWQRFYAACGYSSRWTTASREARGVGILWRLASAQPSQVVYDDEGRWLHVCLSRHSAALRVVAIYAPTRAAERGGWFSKLALELGSFHQSDSEQWLLGGDWNFVMNSEDRVWMAQSDTHRQRNEPGRWQRNAYSTASMCTMQSQATSGYQGAA